MGMIPLSRETRDLRSAIQERILFREGMKSDNMEYHFY